MTDRISASEEFFKRKMLGQTEIGCPQIQIQTTIGLALFVVVFVCIIIFRSCGHLGGGWRLLWKSTVGGRHPDFLAPTGDLNVTMQHFFTGSLLWPYYGPSIWRFHNVTVHPGRSAAVFKAVSLP